MVGYALVADLTPWAGVIGAAIGASGAILATLVTTVLRHRSEITQKKLERQWRLEDQQAAEHALAKRQIDAEIGAKFGFFLDIKTAGDTKDAAAALRNFKSWLQEHPRWLRSGTINNFCGNFLKDSFISHLESSAPTTLIETMTCFLNRLDFSELANDALRWW